MVSQIQCYCSLNVIYSKWLSQRMLYVISAAQRVSDCVMTFVSEMVTFWMNRIHFYSFNGTSVLAYIWSMIIKNLMIHRMIDMCFTHMLFIYRRDGWQRMVIELFKRIKLQVVYLVFSILWVMQVWSLPFQNTVLPWIWVKNRYGVKHIYDMSLKSV